MALPEMPSRWARWEERLRARAFHEPWAARRLMLVRVGVGLACALQAALGVDARFYAESAPLLLRSGWPALSLGVLRMLQLCAVLSGLGLAWGRWAPSFFGALLLASAGTLSLYVSGFGELFSYNTHLLFFLLILCLLQTWGAWRHADAPGELSRAAFAVWALRFVVGVLYLQSGLSKLRNGGPGWFSSGDTLHALTLTYGRAWARSALLAHPTVARLATLGTGLYELGFLPLMLMGPRVRAVLGVALVAFHGSIFFVAGISFWHLVVIAPGLYVPVSAFRAPAPTLSPLAPAR